MSGPALKAVGVAAVRKIRERVDVPIIGVGGILSGADVLEYLRAGAALVQIGTASFAAPRAAERVIRGLEQRVRSSGSRHLNDLVPIPEKTTTAHLRAD